MNASPLFVRSNDCPTKFSSKVDHNSSGQNGIEVAYLDFTTLQYAQVFFQLRHSVNEQLSGLKRKLFLERHVFQYLLDQVELLNRVHSRFVFKDEHSNLHGLGTPNEAFFH